MAGNLHYGLALIHAERGDMSSAVRELEFSLRISGGSSELNNFLSRCRQAQVTCPTAKKIECKPHAIRAISASADGQLVAMVSDPHSESDSDECLTIWDPERGECVARFDRCPHEFDSMGKPQGHCVAWVKGRRQVVTGGIMGPLLLWDLDRGSVVRQFLGHDNIVTALRASDDGRYLVSGSADHTVRLWDLARGVESITMHRHDAPHVSFSETKLGVPGTRVFNGNTKWVDSVAISTESRLAVSGGEDATVRVWDFETGESRGTWPGHESRVKSLIVIPDLALIVSGGDDGTIRLWEISSGQTRGILRGHTSTVTALRYSRATGWLFSASLDGTVGIWHLATRRCIRTFDEAKIAIQDMDLTGDGRRCIFADRNGFLRALEPSIGPEAPFLLARPTAQTALSEDQSRVRALKGQAETARNHGDFFRAIGLVDTARQIEGYEHSPKLLTLRHSFGVSLRRISVIEIFDRYVWREHLGAVKAIVALDSLVASGGEDGSLILWNIHSGKVDFRETAHSGCLRALAASGDGAQLVSGGDDGIVRRLSLADRTSLNGPGHYKSVYAVAFLSNARLVVSGGQDGTLRIRDAATWECTQILRVGDQRVPSVTDIMSRSILSIAVGPGARSVFTGGNGKVHCWDLDRASVVDSFVQEGMRYVRELFVTPDARRLLVGGNRVEGSGSNLVRTDVCRLIQASDGKCVEQLEGIHPLAVSRDGSVFMAVDGGDIGIYWTDSLSLVTKVRSSGANITAATFSGDTRFLLIGRKDGTIQTMEIIWGYESSPGFDVQGKHIM